jgi:2,4-dienoyl-CoA reductase-like NADH-dependent reductase (Old Yellow Enzyme family)
MDKNEILLSPIKIGPHTSDNRFFVQAMECADADAEGKRLPSQIRTAHG